MLDTTVWHPDPSRHLPGQGARLAAAGHQPTLLFELFEQGQAGDAGPREDDVVLAGSVPAQAPGHHAVELGLVLQRVQPIGAPAFLQVDVDL